MTGFIFGDIVGSVYENRGHSALPDFELYHAYAKFTDDTVLSIATAEALLQSSDFKESYLKWGRKYPAAGYGGSFTNWLASSSPQPYSSFGNGSAMRSGPIGWLSKSIEECLQLAKSSAEVTHNHPEGIKGAQAVAIAVFLAKKGHSKLEIKQFIETTFQYSLNRTLAAIMPNYSFQIACQDSVPEAIICFLESESTEDAIRKAVMLNGDTDTQACIAGGIAEAFYRDISSTTELQINAYLSEEMKSVLEAFKLRCAI